MNQTQTEVNIVLCGSPRVGKSSLINALCQQRIAKSTTSLNSDTKDLNKYQMEYTKNNQFHRIIFWDLPGIESWSETDVRDHMKKLITATKPLCMIYCASPGSFAKLDHVKWLASECADQKIFCAFVCTNMWAGRNRQVILKEFRDILQTIHPNVQPNEVDKVIYFDRFGLCIMVNSETYIDDDIDLRKDPSGINELILGIAKSLSQEDRDAWFQVIDQNQSFWSQTTLESKKLFDDRHCSGTELFSQPMGFVQDSSSSTNDSNVDKVPSIITNSEDQKTVVDKISSDNLVMTTTENDQSESNETTSREQPSDMESDHNTAPGIYKDSHFDNCELMQQTTF